MTRDNTASGIHDPSVVGTDSEPDPKTLLALEAIRSGRSHRLELQTPASPAVWEAISGLDGASIRELLLDAGGVGARGSDFSQMPNLEHLRIRLEPLDDRFLERLAMHNKKLRILNIPQAEITHLGLDSLAGLPALRQLRIGGSTIDDEAVRSISHFPALRNLHLIGPQITGEALRHLEKAPKLASLYIDDCPLPDAAWVNLFQAKPKLHVHIDQQHHDRDPKAHSHGAVQAGQ